LGGPIAASLASEGAHIALAHIDAATLCWVEAGINPSGSMALAVPFDLAAVALVTARCSLRPPEAHDRSRTTKNRDVLVFATDFLQDLAESPNVVSYLKGEFPAWANRELIRVYRE